MFRLNSNTAFARHCLMTFLAVGFSTTIAHAQNADEPQVSRELWQLLSDWSNASSRVQKLSGEHQRHSYNRTFGIEKISKGKFWHEAPDKGRIDVFPIQITPDMIAEREKPDAQVERKDGKPFQLQSDDQERWICDGTKVYDIDDEQKTARIAHLPPQVRGQNIMNSPLPFLFGMPPDKAVERFTMTIARDYRPKYNVVHLKALPRMRQDAQNWSRAEVFLDTSTFLPTAVKLVDPAETTDTVYKFSAMEVNKSGLIERILGKNPWDPKLGRDYKVHVIQPGQDESQQAQPSTPDVLQPGMVPNVVGFNHVEATKMLLQAGVPETSIKRLNAGPAPRDQLTFIVSAQDPRPNTRISDVDSVILKIYDKAQQGADTGQRSTSKVAQRP